jgi:hypothetical protein
MRSTSGMTCCHFFCSRQPIFHQARAELLLGHLQRLGGGRRLPDLHRVVFAQRIAVPVLGHQQTPRIRMAVEGDPEQIPHLALEPVRRGPEIADRRHVRIGTVERHLHAQTQAVGDRHEDVDQFEARLARPEIDGGDLGEEPERQLRPVAQDAGDGVHIISPDVDRRLEIDGCGCLDPGLRQRFAHQRNERWRVHQASFCWEILRWSCTMP